MGADVTDDTAVRFLVEEPVGSRLWIHAVGSGSKCLNHLSDGTFPDQMASLDRRFVLHPLTVQNGIDALRLFLYFPDFFKLFECDDAGLVGHEILSVLH